VPIISKVYNCVGMYINYIYKSILQKNNAKIKTLTFYMDKFAKFAPRRNNLIYGILQPKLYVSKLRRPFIQTNCVCILNHFKAFFEVHICDFQKSKGLIDLVMNYVVGVLP